MELDNKPFIDKYTFRHVLRDIQNVLSFQDKLDALTVEYGKIVGYCDEEPVILFPTLLDDTVTLMENAMQDSNGIIYTWIFDRRFGRKKIGDSSSEYSFLDKIEDADELYDYLLSIRNLIQ